MQTFNTILAERFSKDKKRWERIVTEVYKVLCSFSHSIRPLVQQDKSRQSKRINYNICRIEANCRTR